MKKTEIATGIQEFIINEKHVLRFNPTDPNLYAKFVEAAETIKTLEQKQAQQIMVAKKSDDGIFKTLQIMRKTDKEIKNILNGVFGNGNDFDALLDGVSLLAIANNKERVITNLMNFLTPILEEGAKAYADQEVVFARDARNARKEHKDT